MRLSLNNCLSSLPPASSLLCLPLGAEFPLAIHKQRILLGHYLCFRAEIQGRWGRKEVTWLKSVVEGAFRVAGKDAMGVSLWEVQNVWELSVKFNKLPWLCKIKNPFVLHLQQMYIQRLAEFFKLWYQTQVRKMVFIFRKDAEVERNQELSWSECQHEDSCKALLQQRWCERRWFLNDKGSKVRPSRGGHPWEAAVEA